MATQLEVANFLTQLKNAVENNNYLIANREENERLFYDYILSEEKVKEILLSLDVTDFNKMTYNRREGYKNELLYIFGKEVYLMPKFDDDERKVALYIKFREKRNFFIVVVSFHEQRYPLKYQFK